MIFWIILTQIFLRYFFADFLDYFFRMLGDSFSWGSSVKSNIRSKRARLHWHPPARSADSV